MNGLPKSHQPGDASESRYNGEAAASQMRDRLATPHRPGDFLTMLIPMGRLPPWLATQTRDGLATPHHPGDLRKADANREAVALAWLPNEGLSCKSMTAMVTPLQALVPDDFVEVKYAIKRRGFSSIRQVNDNSHSHPSPGLQHNPGLFQEDGGWLTVHIIAEEKMLLRDKMLDALSDEKDKFQKVRVGVYPQAPTRTREGQAPPTRHDNITVSTFVDSVVTGIGKRRCGDGGEQEKDKHIRPRSMIDKNRLELLENERHSIERTLLLLLLRGRLLVQLLHLMGRLGDGSRLCVVRPRAVEARV
ncbi:hypothetical protein DFH94DRAFT_843640 [Russula ochroleuca]|uniref:Uncharacterized protein n=1 Tax=Russula ochroleuca TaxID=152965 RepID=A0A9P5MZC7_9AGAM|nr:hypothetical protein DFH94DRAFT_843640 [Russula ochroleuca]